MLPDILSLKQYRHGQVSIYEVWSLQDIPMGIMFGPCKEILIRIKKDDIREDPHKQAERKEKEILILDETSETLSNWLPYVNYSHSEEEANLITFLTKSGIYYITCRLIPANTELLICDQVYHHFQDMTAGGESTRNSENVERNELINDEFPESENKVTCDVKSQQLFTLNSKLTGESSLEISKTKSHFSLTRESRELIRAKVDKPYTKKIEKSIHHENTLKAIYQHNVNYRIGVFRETNTSRDSNSEQTKEYAISYMYQAETNLANQKWKQFISSFNINERIHTGEKDFECSKCGKKFAHRYHLTRHERTHTGEKPFVCNDCGKRFTQKSTLISHERIHSGERPFECSDCKKKFIQRSHLISHERIHSGEKPFECSDCGKKFTHKRALTRHKRIHCG